MSLRTRLSTRVAAVAVAALAGAGLTVGLTTAPAGAASGTITYTCTTALGASDMAVTLDSTLPAQMAPGATANYDLAAGVTVPEGLVNAARDVLQAATVEGSVAATGDINGAPVTGNLAIPVTNLPASGSLPLAANGTGGQVAPTAPGSLVLKAGNFTADLIFKKADGSQAYFIDDMPCVVKAATPAQNTTVDTVKVVAPSTTTLALARSTAAYGQATTATATVSSAFTAPAGSVVFTVGGKTITKAISAGKATVTLPTLNAGKTYAVKATYKPASSAPYTASSATKSLKVVADSTKTTAVAPDIKKGGKARAAVTVKSAHGKTVTGKVEAKLFKGTKLLGKVTVALKGGKVTVVFGKPLTVVGTGYKVVVKYLPSTNFKTSTDSDPFRVKP
ncbi:Ig-like domain-containing protein [Nocardioides speluncae]|uniref:Ig-like domain-containing protein n=1 Tax=Nocardioides speluncae TaxID=2670337 RepID=UPI000D6912AE|nr:Ig-like domain repeat protein [Nocardioides speluncae]